MATGGPHVRRPAVKGVRVLSGWQVDQVAGEASWVQMCWACWEGTCATWTCDGPWPLSIKRTASDPLRPSVPLSLPPSPFSPSSSVLPVLQRGCQRLLMLWGGGGWNETGEGVMGWRRPVVRAGVRGWRRCPQDGEPQAWRAC